MEPKIAKTKVPFTIKSCSWCGGTYGSESFTKVNSPFYKDGVMPMCNSCIRDYLEKEDFSWRAVNKLCQCSNIPFVPAEFERLKELNGENVFPIYAQVFQDKEFEGLDWQIYDEKFRELEINKEIEDELPRIREEKYRKLREKWGSNYDDEELNYLEQLYVGLLTTQNVAGALQDDQALKVCKISLEIDNRIRAGQEIDKMLTSYDKIVKVADFTPKNVKNVSDFDSVGELAKWLEKRGWRPKYYDNVTRDVVDETLKNIESSNQRLYTNENGIGEEITRRIEALKTTESDIQNTYYGLEVNREELATYDSEGYEGLFDDGEEFEVNLE